MKTNTGTRLDAFLKGAPFSAGKLARAADMPIQTLTQLRSGKSEPKASTIGRLVRAASTLLGKPISAQDLFNLQGDERR